MSSSTKGSGGASASPIAEALEKNKQATEEVKRAADDLAVAETSQVEKRLTKSAEKLDQVNETLDHSLRRAG